jgi:hypothetical protein
MIDPAIAILPGNGRSNRIGASTAAEILTGRRDAPTIAVGGRKGSASDDFSSAFYRGRP